MSNVESDFIELAKRFASIEKSWSNDTTVKKEMQVGIFLLLDEFAVLRIALIRKNCRKINGSLRRIIADG